MADADPGTTDNLDDLAAFVMHRTAEPDLTAAERLEMFAAVEGYQEGDDATVIERALRSIASRYAAHPDYRQEWQPVSAPDATT